jgi:hypothetical protein
MIKLSSLSFCKASILVIFFFLCTVGNAQKYYFQSDTTGGIKLSLNQNDYIFDSYLVDRTTIFSFNQDQNRDYFKVEMGKVGKKGRSIQYILDYQGDSLYNIRIINEDYDKGYLIKKTEYWTYMSDSIIKQTTNYKKGSKYGHTVELYSDGHVFAIGKYNGTSISKRYNIEKLDMTFYITNNNDTIYIDSTKNDGEPSKFFIKYGIPYFSETSPFYLKKGKWEYYNERGELIRREHYNRKGIRKKVEKIKEITWNKEEDFKICPTLKEYNKYISKNLVE